VPIKPLDGGHVHACAFLTLHKGQGGREAHSACLSFLPAGSINSWALMALADLKPCIGVPSRLTLTHPSLHPRPLYQHSVVMFRKSAAVLVALFGLAAAKSESIYP
jgi:hypothetical protein